MSRFRFEIPTEEAAREFLSWRRRNEMYQGELHIDALACQRRLLPVTTAAEREELETYNQEREDARWGGES